MIKSIYVLVLGLALLAGSPPVALAQTTLYVTDELSVTVRSGPSTENKVLDVVKSGDRVTVLDKGEQGWSRVRTVDGTEGWMLDRYLQSEVPAGVRLKELDPEHKTLMEKLEELTRSNDQLRDELTKARKHNEQLESSYAKLEADSAGVVKLRKAHQELQKSYKEQSAKLDEVSAEVESLRFGGNLKWFLAGAGVLVLGWIMGLAVGRRRKRPHSSLY